MRVVTVEKNMGPPLIVFCGIFLPFHKVVVNDEVKMQTYAICLPLNASVAGRP